MVPATLIHIRFTPISQFHSADAGFLFVRVQWWCVMTVPDGMQSKPYIRPHGFPECCRNDGRIISSPSTYFLGLPIQGSFLSFPSIILIIICLSFPFRVKIMSSVVHISHHIDPSTWTAIDHSYFYVVYDPPFRFDSITDFSFLSYVSLLSLLSNSSVKKF